MKSSIYKKTFNNRQIRKKIIYVDDVNYSLLSVKSRLRKYYEVYTAESSVKLFEYLDNFKPEMILLDVNMPDIDGYEIIKSLKVDNRYADIPVIFLTSNSDKESVVKGLSLGAADYMIKPFSTEKLIKTLDNILYPKDLKQSSQEEGNDNKPNILAVDDAVSMLRAIQYALRDRYRVNLLSKSEDVLDFLKTEKPDLILLDYVMPTLNGFDLINIIKKMPDNKDTPIIILTTEGTPEHVNEAINLGASDFIVKPFNPKELNNKVAKHIRIARELQKIREDALELYG